MFNRRIIFNKILSGFISLILLFQSFAPALAFAQEATPDETPPQEQTQIVEPSETPKPTEEPSPAPTSTSTPTPVPTPTSTPVPESISTDSAKVEPSATPSIWQNSDGISTTTSSVTLNTTYKAPQNDKVSVTFTKLPENPGKLTIKEIKLSKEEQSEIGAFSDTAYDITSDMTDGIFEYDLTLPIPDSAKGKQIEVKSGETTDDISQNVDQPKTTKDDVITITGLNHFTVFVLVPPTTTGVTNQAIAVEADSYIRENATTTNSGTATTMSVYSKTSNNRRAMVKFDLSAIPTGSTVSNATLNLFLTNAPVSSRQHNIYRITSDWIEGDGGTNNSPAGEVAWDNLNGTRTPILTFDGIPTASANTGTVDNTVISYDVTADVNAYLAGTATNYGWLIKDNTESATTTTDYQTDYFTSEYNTDSTKRPQLSITFDQSNISGYHYATSETAVTTAGTAGDDNGYQTNPTSAFAPDNIYAVDTDSGDSVNDTCAGVGSDRHVFSNFDLDTQIPNYSIINGIEVRQDLKVDSLTNSPFSCVELSYDGGNTWTSVEHKSTLSSTSETSYTFGSNSDTWGRTWVKNETTNELSNTNFKIRVTNGDTNSGSSSRDFSLDWLGVKVYSTPDTTAPTTTDSGIDADWHNSDVTVTFSCLDAVSGCANTYYTTDGSTPTTSSSSGTSATLTTNGIYTIKYFSKDNAGNSESVKTATNTVKIDKTKPVISGSLSPAANANGWNNTDVIASFSCQDALSGINTDTVAGSTLTSEGSNQSVSNAGTCTDLAGNTADQATLTNINIDKTNPTNPGTPTTSTPTSNTSPTWSWNASTDAVSLLSHYILFWDTISGGEANNSGNITTTNFTIPSALGENTWYAKVKAFDNAGNSTTGGDGSVVIDTTAPTAPIVSVSNPVNNSNKTNVTVSGTGEIGTFVTYIITDGVNTLSGSGGTVDGSGNFSISNLDLSTIDDGARSVDVTLTDAAGNSSSVGTANFTKDTVNPSLSSVSISSNNTDSSTAKVGDIVTLTFTSSESIATPTITISGNAALVTGGPTNWSATYTMTSSDTEGIVPFNISYADLNGNSDTAVSSASSTVLFDKTNPVAVSVSDSANTTFNPHLTFNWPASTDANGVSYYQFWLSTSATETDALHLDISHDWKNIGNVTTYTLTDAEAASLVAGTTYFAQVRAVDGAGNIATNSTLNWSDGITFSTVVTPSDLSTLLTGGVFSLPNTATNTSTPNVTVNQPTTINVTESGGTNSIILPTGVVITKTDGTNLDATAITATDSSSGSLSGLASGEVVEGALQWGIPNIGLSFSTPITISIFVGTPFNGKTLNIFRSTSTSSGWTQDGLLAHSCVVSAGLCTFQTTKASYFATTSFPPSSPASSSGSDGLGCGSHDCSGVTPAASQSVVPGVSTGSSSGLGGEVLGISTQSGNVGLGEEEKTEPTPSPESNVNEEKGAVLGEKTQPAATAQGRNWILIIAVLLAGGSVGYLIFRRFSKS